MRSFQHIYPRDLDHALEILRARGAGAEVIAGGSDLLAMMKEGLRMPEVLVNLQRIQGLDTVRFDERRGLRIGGMTRLRTLETDPMLAARFTALAQSAASVASPQIRNVATIGGNLAQRTRCWYYRGPFPCWLKGGTECFAVHGENKFHAVFGEGPCVMVQASDIATALLALEGQVVIAGPGGTRKVPAGRFFVNPTADRRRENTLRPDEILTEVTVPTPVKGTRSGFLKCTERRDWDAAIVSIAYALVEEDGVCRQAAIVLGGVATTPRRASEAERELTGRRLTPSVIAKAADALVAGAHPLSQNGYKIPLLKGYFRAIFA